MPEPLHCMRCGRDFMGDAAAHYEHHCANPPPPSRLVPTSFGFMGVGLWLREFLQAADAELEGDVVFSQGQRPAHAITFIDGKFCLLGRELLEIQEIDFDKPPKQLVAEIKALLATAPEEFTLIDHLAQQLDPAPASTPLCRHQAGERFCKLLAGHKEDFHTDGQGRWPNEPPDLDPESDDYVGHTEARRLGAPCLCRLVGERHDLLSSGIPGRVPLPRRIDNINCPYHGR